MMLETPRSYVLMAATLVAAAAAAGLTACRPAPGADGFVGKDAKGVITLAIGATADLAEPVSAFRLTDHFEEVGTILPGDDPSTYLMNPRFAFFDEESVLAFARDRVLRLSIRDGSFLCAYGRPGRGPGEYIQTDQCYVRGGEVYVNDILSNYHVYAAEDGKLLREAPVAEDRSQFNILGPLEGEYSLVCYSSMSTKDHLFDVVDASGKVVREGSVPVDFEEARRQGGIRLGRYVRMNGYTCVSDDNYDLYRVLPKRDELWIRFDRGDYTQRSDRRLSVGNLKAIGPFFFLELHMDRTDVMAIYDLDSRRLVFTSTYSAQKDGVERYHTWGIPYERDGETLYLQPVMAERDLLVCRDRTEPDNYYIFRQK